MSSVIGVIMILAAGVGVCYFGYTLIQDIRVKLKDKRKPTDKK